MNAREWSIRIAELARREHAALADLLLAVAEFDAGAVYRQLGFSSLFDFLHREVGLSRGSAYYRQVGARMVRRFPEVEEPIRDGRLCITTVSELAKVMTEENRAEVLPMFFGLSRQEAKQLVATLRPMELVPMRTVVTEVPLLAPMDPAPVEAPDIVQPVGRFVTHPGRNAPVPGPPRTVVEPMTSTETRLHITVSPEFVALLKKAKAGQSHVQPNATDVQVLTAALELFVAQQEKRKASVPAKVKREVVKRDGGKCQWPTNDGGICGAEVRTEIDHVVPRARGGPSTVENCRVLCRAHNLEAAREAYGDEVMDRYARNPVVREDCAGGFSRSLQRSVKHICG
ncbi:MAG: HNH endonuclease signature motif containing protein [Deltaproteobacteria bacterium]